MEDKQDGISHMGDFGLLLYRLGSLFFFVEKTGGILGKQQDDGSE